MDEPSLPLSGFVPSPREQSTSEAPPAPASSTAAPPPIVKMAILFEGGLAVLACAIGLFMATPPWKQVAWRWEDAAWGLAATVPMVAGLLAMRRAQRGPLGRLNQVVDTLLAPLFGRCSAWQLFVISAIAGIGEEFLFRGVAQFLLVAWVGPVAAVLVASLIFGLLHAITPTYAILATAVGVYLGWLALATGGLLAPIITHALYDFIALLYLTRAGRRSVVPVSAAAG